MSRRVELVPVVLLVALPLLLVPLVRQSRTATAEPAWGGTCMSCHGQVLSTALVVYDADTEADPDESATGATDRGTLKVFRAAPGQTRSFRIEVAGLAEGDTYAASLGGLRYTGVESAGVLSYGADCDWAQWSPGGSYYTDPAVMYRWGSGPALLDYDITVSADADHDYYDLTLGVAGKLGGDDTQLFYAEEHVYLWVTYRLGDMNCDGAVNFDDINPFVAALVSEDAYNDQYGGCQWLNGDVDGNNAVNFDDINGFVELLVGE